VFNATVNNILFKSWPLFLMVEEIGESRENHRTATQTTDNFYPKKNKPSTPCHRWQSNSQTSVVLKIDTNVHGCP
jgi:hypothetical protein